MRGAFSLIELVIVIVILGIISAIAVPRISRGSSGADEAALRSNLKVLRTAIECYAAEHRGVFPGFYKANGSAGGEEDDFVKQLTRHTSINGVVGDYDPSNGVIYGPYLYGDVPELPVPPGSNEVIFEYENPPYGDNSGGWVYNPEAGIIRANSTSLDSKGVSYLEY
jgi:general secretion pathway protein G